MCGGDGSAGVGFGGGVVAVSAYMGGTRGSGVLASAGDVQKISVVRGVVYDMCMCSWCGWTVCTRVWEGGVVLCLCVL